MHQAVLNIKSLLVKWAILLACLAFLLVNLLNRGSAAQEHTQAFSQVSIVENSGESKAEINLTSENKNQQSILPPFKSESDLEAKKAKVARTKLVSFNSSGNTYYRGYCTWYAKFKRPDLPNSLGDARTWFSRAKAAGLSTGSKPKPGAIGQTGNHVVYVEKVNSNGTVSISEMNYRGFGVISTRTVPASSFRYIY